MTTAGLSQPQTLAAPDGDPPRAASAAGADPDIRVATGWEELISLRNPWSRLAELVGADGFSQPEFCIPCWSEGAAGAPHVLQAWVGEELVALAPLTQRRSGLGQLFGQLGTGPNAAASFLVAPGHEALLATLCERLVVPGAGLELRRLRGPVLTALHSVAPGLALSAEVPTRSFAATELRTAGTPGLTVERDADELIAQAALVTECSNAMDDTAGPGLPGPLVQSVLDTSLRAGRGFLIRDEWRGAAAWLLGGQEASLWWASGTCAPGGPQWLAGLATAAAAALEAGRLTCVLPPGHTVSPQLPGAALPASAAMTHPGALAQLRTRLPHRLARRLSR